MGETDQTDQKRDQRLDVFAGDDNSTFGRIMDRIGSLSPRWLAALLIGVLALVWTVARIGVPSILASIPLVDKLIEYRAAGTPDVSGQLDRIESQGVQTDLTVRAIGEDVQRLDGRVTAIEDAHD